MASPQVIAGSGTAVHEHGDPGSRWPPFYLTMYTAARILSGESPGKPLKDLVAKISPTPLLLIATGGSLPVERDFNRIYRQAAREPVEYWDLPDVDHTAAIRQRPDEYERRVVGLFIAPPPPRRAPPARP